MISFGPSPNASERVRVGLGTAGLLALLVSWQIGASAGVLNPLIFSSPAEIVGAFGRETSSGALWSALAISLGEYCAGLAIAIAIGLLIGFFAGGSRRGGYVLDPWVSALYSAPLVALVPMIILVLGIDFAAKTLVVVLVCVFYIVVNTSTGVHGASGRLVDVAAVFGASRLERWASVIVPGAIPNILVGLRLAASHGMVGVVVADLIAGNSGIGFALNQAGATLETATVMLYILLLGLFGVVVSEVVRFGEVRVASWRVS